MLDIIFFAALAVFVAFKLKSVLGNEYQDSPVKKDGQQEKRGAIAIMKDVTNSVLKKQPTKAENAKEAEKQIAASKVADQGYVNSLSEQSVDAINKIKEIDPSFSIHEFIKNAKQAFEAIVESWNSGNLAALEVSASKKVFEGFKKEIESRAAQDIVYKNYILSISEPRLILVKVDQNVVQATVKFLSQQINYTEDKLGNIIDGDKKSVNEIEETWKFEKLLHDKNSAWILCETGL